MQAYRSTFSFKLYAMITALTMLLSSIIFTTGGGTASAEAPTVTTSAQVTPGSVAAGTTAVVNVDVTSTEAASLLLDVEVFDASLQKVYQIFKDNIAVEAAQQQTVPFEWNVPANTAPGSYIVSVGVFGAGWSGMYDWHAGATSFQVVAGQPVLTITSSASADTAQALPGSTVHVNAAVTASLATEALTQMSLVGPDGAIVASKEYADTLEAGAAKTYSLDWTVPAGAAEGVYHIAVQVLSADRSTTLHTNSAAGQFTIGTNSTPDPVLSAPTNLTAASETNSIHLTWDQVRSATAYELEADGISLGDFNTNSYTHSGLQPDTAHSYRVRAKSPSAVSVWSEPVMARTLQEQVSSQLTVNVKTGNSASTQMPTPEIEIFNTGSTPVPLSEVTARYYFTIDSERPLTVGFWTTAPKEFVTARFVKMPIPSADADYYLEVSFAAGAGQLQPSSKVGVYTWINKSDWSSFDQTNDYSYSSSGSSVPNEKVTAYRSGVLEWGTEPTLLDIPASPSNITAKPADTSILLTWDQVVGATSYDVDADGTVVENIQTNSYLNQWLRPGTRHSYKVRSRKGENVSSWSSAVNVKTTGEQDLPAPVNVRGTTTEASISLKWDALEEEVTGYEVEVDGSIIPVGPALTYVHSGLAAGTAHTYRVRAKDGETSGRWSSPLRTNTVYTPTGTFDVQFTVDTSAERAPISPYIYGTNDDLTGTEHWGSRRMGGNRMSTYNWENNASNAGEDYFEMSDNYIPWYYGGVPWGGNMDDPGIGVMGFYNKSLEMGAYTLTTLQTAGFVAKDKNGAVSDSEKAPSSRWVQVKPAKNAPFSLTPDTNDNAVYMDEFVNLLVHKYGNASTPTGIKGYSLDNEPSLWQSTHPLMHPSKPGAVEVLTKGIDTAKAVKHVDPYAEIYGPAAYSFDELYSMHAADDWNAIKGNYKWYVDYYLDKFRVASEQENTRLLDSLDFHWYPEISAGGYRITDEGSYTNLEANKARMQAPRSLWDPTYTENSWIGQWYSSFLPVLPRVQQSIDQYNPGTKMAITEYNYGGENNVYGGIAQADVLGIFGKYGVHLATFWKMVNSLKDALYISSAVKMFTDYDGNGGKFGDTKVKAETNNIENSSIYGSIVASSDDELHLIVMNKNNDFDMNAVLNIAGSGTYTSARVYAFDSESSEITEREGVTNITNNTFTYTVPKLTVAHIILSK
ncbi:glycoside hydrolase family 44 protein [Paenibacillus hexagrammi]|uniref:Endo-1,4-beta-glucanase n=1 Tax=Paenibacillus hexagrammi TaxID=2908839 RepID=A0ABY3SHJ1_9BACL|nr:glycoside hydrolase family 44 protein [Paenibacillus sp. YPD9-1]UJF33416.1 hypothetical protein L0M14_28570 [Paenibacillus sp. YPD9-1]